MTIQIEPARSQDVDAILKLLAENSRRYADIAASLGDVRLSSSLGDLGPDAGGGSSAEGWKVLQGLLAFVNNSLVFSDPPRHTRLRALVSRAFTPRYSGTSTPAVMPASSASAAGNPATTSASPPDIANGATSLATCRTRMLSRCPRTS